MVQRPLPMWTDQAPFMGYLHLLPSLQPTQIFVYSLFFLLGGYCLLQRLDHFPLLPLTDLLWNALVYVTPSSMVMALDSRAATSLEKEMDDPGTYSQSRTFAAKSEAMRRVFGLDGTGLMTKLQRASTLSGVGSIIKGHDSSALPGLGNFDNSCYQNSIIQGLAALPSLPRFLKTVGHYDDLDKNISMTAALGEIIHGLNDPENIGRRLWTPAPLKNMSSFSQQDAQEYFSKVIDDLEKEVVRNAKTQEVNEGLRDIKTMGKHNGNFHQTEVSTGHIPQNPLEGLLAQRVGCLQCGYVEGLSLVPFNCITVPLENAYKLGYHISECLDRYTDLETIPGVDCGRCTLLQQKEQLQKMLANMQTAAAEGLRTSTSSRLLAVEEALRNEDFSENTIGKKCQVPKKGRVSSNKSRQAVIARCPDALVLHINRSVFDETTFAMTKNNASVSFPSILDLSDWCLGKVSREDGDEIQGWSADPNVSLLAGALPEPDTSLKMRTKGMEYNLRAIIVHQGRHENGHYVCYRRDPTDFDRWWRLSDETVTEVSKEQVLSAHGVYMLFYERISADQDSLAESTESAVSSTTTRTQLTDTAAAPTTENSINFNEANTQDLASVEITNTLISHGTESKPPKAQIDIPGSALVNGETVPESTETSKGEVVSPSDAEVSWTKVEPVVPAMRTAGARKKRSKKKQRGMAGMSNNMVAAN